VVKLRARARPASMPERALVQHIEKLASILQARVLSVFAAAVHQLEWILSVGCDGGPSVVSGERRFQVVGGRAVVVGTGGVCINRGQPGLVAAGRRR
jgi:hypothetical protein